MLKDILILLWILIIPLVITIRQLFQDSYSIFLIQKEKQKISFDKKFELFCAIFFLTYGAAYMAPMFIKDGILSIVEGILGAEILCFDFLVTFIYLFFYLEKHKSEKDKDKAALIGFLAFVNLLTSEWWLIQGKLSPMVVWTSAIAYPVFGVSHVISYYLERWRND